MVRNSIETDLVTVFKARDETRGMMKNMDSQVKTVNKGFSQMAKVMGAVGLGSISMGFLIRGAVASMDEARRIGASAQLTIGAFGEDTAKNFEQIAGSLEGVGREFRFTANQAAQAFNIMVRDSEGMVIAVDDVRFALGLARAESISVAEASRTVALFKRGETEAWRALVGPARSYRVELENVTRAGKDAIGIGDETGFITKVAVEETAKGIGGLIEFYKKEARFIGRIFGGGGGGGGSSRSSGAVPTPGVTIIVQGDIKDESTARELAREVERAMSDASRKGLGVRGTGASFP